MNKNLRHRLTKKIRVLLALLYSKSNTGNMKSLPAGCSSSYSQCGEDLIMSYVLRLRGVNRVSYLDIGAHHPWSLSNTAYFYLGGSSGVVVEPNQFYSDLFREQRPNDIVCNLAISSQVKTLKYYLFEDSTLNTLSCDEMTNLRKLGHKLIGEKDVPAILANDLLEKYYPSGHIDIISIDAEGMDLAILRSIDYHRFRPKIICVETVEYSLTGEGLKRSDLVHFLVSQSYIEYAFTGLNSIFLDEKFWKK